MKRAIINDLVAWKNSKYRKPLIIKGVRQVGKTWVLKEFGKHHYENYVYFNFDENPEYKDFFENTKDVKRIIPNLAIAKGEKINKETTLIIFDEVQDCPNVINSMKYFYENGNEYHVVCAGSLLGVALAKPSSFPVGMVDFLRVNPMTFTEFLWASGDDNLADYIANLNSIEKIPEAFFNQLYEKLKFYYITGGMPEAVKIWVLEQDISLLERVLSGILDSYQIDFGKYPNSSTHPKISAIWNSIPSQLSRENKKYLYKLVKPGARAREYEDALQWLVDAQLVSKIFCSAKPGLPISAYDDVSAFKLYLVDIGLLRRLARLSPAILIEGNRLFTEFKGAFSENYVLEALDNQLEVTPRYWSKQNPNYEVDFLVQYDNYIIPIEVKAESNIKSTSLKKFKELYPDETKLRVRFSLSNLSLDDDLLNIPIFMADYAKKLIAIALKSRK
ncbi:MAG: ATP-binding protein [Lactobacillales bacterium]|jgi:predicted AAA+ superfamily ATPase|nr:ATP-binding protein [Lactobacillales bacterium]